MPVAAVIAKDDIIWLEKAENTHRIRLLPEVGVRGTKENTARVIFEDNLIEPAQKAHPTEKRNIIYHRNDTKNSKATPANATIVPRINLCFSIFLTISPKLLRSGIALLADALPLEHFPESGQ
jgi:hypothetical protein